MQMQTDWRSGWRNQLWKDTQEQDGARRSRSINETVGESAPPCYLICAVTKRQNGEEPRPQRHDGEACAARPAWPLLLQSPRHPMKSDHQGRPPRQIKLKLKARLTKVAEGMWQTLKEELKSQLLTHSVVGFEARCESEGPSCKGFCWAMMARSMRWVVCGTAELGKSSRFFL